MYSRGARILDGAFMTQDLSFRATNSETAMTVSSVSIADPYVLLMMTDGSIQLLVGGKLIMSAVFFYYIHSGLYSICVDSYGFMFCVYVVISTAKRISKVCTSFLII